MTRQETARQRSITSALDQERAEHERAEHERAEYERAGEATDLARQFVATLHAMRPSDWLELGLVF
jgi:hypothetical protein